MDELTQELEAYFSARDDFAFALIFGSSAMGRRRTDSDVDIAVYFKDDGKELHLEEETRFFEQEEAVWRDLELIAGTEVDLLVLNRAPATIAAAAIAGGHILSCADPRRFGRYTLAATLLAEDERRFAEDFRRIKARSQSISEIDRDRLAGIIDFVDSELSDFATIAPFSRSRYFSDSAYRRNVERWIENLVNASVDIAKILLSAGGQTIPQTYREALLRLSIIHGFDEKDCETLSAFTKLRDLWAHEYLDYRFPAIDECLRIGPAIYRRLIEATEKHLAGN